MQTSMYLSGAPGSLVPPGTLQPQEGPATLQVQNHETAGSVTPSVRMPEYPVSAAVPGIHPQDYMISAQGPLDAHQVFLVSSVRNDEIATCGPDPFASDRSRPWGGDPAMRPYMVPPTMQHASMQPQLQQPLGPPLTAQAFSHSHGEVSHQDSTDKLSHAERDAVNVNDAQWAIQHDAELAEKEAMAEDRSRVAWAMHSGKGSLRLNSVLQLTSNQCVYCLPASVQINPVILKALLFYFSPYD